MKIYYDNKYLDEYKKQRNLALKGFLAESPNLFFSILSAIVSNTLFVWADCFLSMVAVLHFSVVFIVMHRLKNENGDRYNFGVERLEVFTSFILNILIIIGYIAFIIIAIGGIINPIKPQDALSNFIIIKFINISFDVYFILNQRRIYDRNKSKLNETELESWKNALILDVIVAIIVIICYFFRNMSWSWYISPIATIVLSLYFGERCIKRINKIINELSDASIEINKQDEIYDIILEHKGIYKKIYSVNCRVLNNNTYIEVELEFFKDTRYEEIRSFLKLLKKEIKDSYSNASIRIVIEDNSEN